MANGEEHPGTEEKAGGAQAAQRSEHTAAVPAAAEWVVLGGLGWGGWGRRNARTALRLVTPSRSPGPRNEAHGSYTCC